MGGWEIDVENQEGVKIQVVCNKGLFTFRLVIFLWITTSIAPWTIFYSWVLSRFLHKGSTWIKTRDTYTRFQVRTMNTNNRSFRTAFTLFLIKIKIELSYIVILAFYFDNTFYLEFSINEKLFKKLKSFMI